MFNKLEKGDYNLNIFTRQFSSCFSNLVADNIIVHEKTSKLALREGK